MLQLRNIVKSYRDGTLAIDHLSVDFETGIIGILGPNGSGKTTLLRMIVGNLQPSEGEILYHAIPIHSQYTSFCAKLGYMPQAVNFYPYFTIQQFLEYMAVNKGLKDSFAKEKINELCQKLSLHPYRYKRIKYLSNGTIKRVGIAQALLNDPEILVLDEPTSELDPKERIAFKKLLSDLSKDHLVLYSTHILSDIENLSDHILMLMNGRVCVWERYEQVIARLQGHVFEAIVDAEEKDALEQTKIVVTSKQIEQTYLVRFISEQPIVQAKSVIPTLEDVYLSIFYEEI